MKVLLDTHVWLWWHLDPDRIHQQALRQMESRANELFLSSVSIWEMAIKIAAGKLKLPEALEVMLPKELASDDIHVLPLLAHHCFELARLPMHHRDPFDRMLVAQAREEDMALMTADVALRKYKVKVLSAR